MTTPLDKPSLAPDAASVSQDADEPQRTEKEAREREELLRFTFDSAPVGIYMADLEERYLKVNIAYQRMIGYSEEELRDKSVFSLTHPDDLPRNQVLREDLIAGKREFFEIEERYYAKSGGLIWVRNKVSLIKNSLGGPPITITVSQDITERKQADEDKQYWQQELVDFVENATIGMHWVTRNGTILWANRIEIEMLGYAPDEYIGHNITEFHADIDVINDVLQRLNRNETLHNYEARLRCKDGSFRYVQIDSNVLWKDGQFIHTRCFTRDITERKLAEQARQDGEQRLRRALEERERLAQDLHDGIVQQIYAIGLGLEETQRLVAEDARAASEGLADAIAGLNKVLREVRRHIIGSAPQILDGQQLRAELQALARTLKGGSGCDFAWKSIRKPYPDCRPTRRPRC